MARLSPTSVVYIDMDDVMCDYSPTHAQLKSDSLPFPQGEIGFFENLPPITGAIKSVNKLRKLARVYVLTAPSIKNVHSYSEKRVWIEEHFDYQFVKRLIISPNKGLLIGDFLIDDLAAGKGQENFGGTLIQFGSEQYPDWKSVLSYLLK